MEVGAGTFHPATILRALGPKRWNAAYVQPSRRPKDGRYGENPNRLQHYYQFQVTLKPSPADIQELYLNSLKTIGIDPALHDIRFVEDDWESPTLGAWGLGWECWCDGMEVTQFTYFQQVAGFECAPVTGEITYGLERLAMYVQGVENVFDLNFNGGSGDKKVTYGDVFRQAEQEYSRHNFEFADTAMLFEQFKMAEAACRKYLSLGWNKDKTRHLMALPAYDQCIKASHVFNLLDARGVISVTERQSYILRVRELAKACGEAWLATEGGRGVGSVGRVPNRLPEIATAETCRRLCTRRRWNPTAANRASRQGRSLQSTIRKRRRRRSAPPRRARATSPAISPAPQRAVAVAELRSALHNKSRRKSSQSRPSAQNRA